jgi:predicted Zn finger-like uncharacterized protein
MIIACPSCETRFEVNAAAFPPGGRKVKCARCAHVWHAASPAGVPLKAVANELSAPAEESIAPPTVMPPPEEAPDVMIWAGSDIPPRRSNRLQVIGIAAACVAVVAAGLLIFRDTVVAYVPGAGPAYAAIGMPVDVTGLDLTIEAQAMTASADGATTLVVTGSVTNPSSEERPVPQIRATLFSKEKAELHSWTFDAGVKTLKPGERHEFRQELAQPPAETYQVYAHFADES